MEDEIYETGVYEDPELAALALVREQQEEEMESKPLKENKKQIDLADKMNDLIYTQGNKGKKNITLCVENIARALMAFPSKFGEFQYDDFKNIHEIYDLQKKGWRAVKDEDFILVQCEISKYFPDFQKVSDKMTRAAIIKVSMENRYDSAVRYLKGLAWDKVARLDTWLCTAYGAKENIYHCKLAANFIKAMVNRIIDPGCKVDFVMVLESEQGTRKSSSLKELVPNGWYTETNMSTDSKDFFMMLQGKLIVEFAEGETLSKTEVKRMKSIITTQVDRYRPSFGYVTQDFPRRCIFTMTTNESEYLKDPTGNRRWFPVRVMFKSIDIEWIKENHDQLFAEAYYRVIKLNETHWEFPLDESLKEQKDRQISEANEELVVDWYEGLEQSRKREGISVSEAFSEGVHGNPPGIYGYAIKKPMTKYEEMQVANILKNALNLTSKQTMISGVRKKRWMTPEHAELDGRVENSVVLERAAAKEVYEDIIKVNQVEEQEF